MSRNRPLAWALPIFVASLAVPSGAHASVPSPRVWARTAPEHIEDDAATAFSRGEAAYAAGDYEGAAEAFSEAQRLVPHPDTAYNLGLAQAKSGSLLEAWDTFDRILRETDEPAIRRDAKAQRDRVGKKIATVTLIASTDDVTCLDGAPAPKGQRIRLLAGAHEVRVGETRRTLELEGGRDHLVELDGRGAAPQKDRKVGVLLGIGIASGAASVGVGAGGLAVDRRGVARTLGIASVGLGTVALASTITALVLRNRAAKPRSAAPRSCGAAQNR